MTNPPDPTAEPMARHPQCRETGSGFCPQCGYRRCLADAQAPLIADEDRRLVERLYPDGSALKLDVAALGKIMAATRADALNSVANEWDAAAPMFRSRIQKNMIAGFVGDLRRAAIAKAEGRQP